MSLISKYDIEFANRIIRSECILRIILVALFCASTGTSNGQSNRVLVSLGQESTDLRPVILVKWFSLELINDEGINLYRKEEHEKAWKKITNLPVKRLSALPKSVSEDKDAEVLAELVKTTSATELKNSMVQLNLLIKSFQSNAFAEYLGIFFTDQDVLAQRRYQYKVMKIVRGKEVLLGESKVIQADQFKPQKQIQKLQVTQDKGRINLNWDHNPELYYGINLFRRSDTEAAFKRINDNPVLISEVTDSTGMFRYPDPLFSESKELKEGNSYSYFITGAGFFEYDTAPSDTAFVQFKDITPPPAPEHLEAKADSMKVRLRWKLIVDDDIDKFNLMRSNKSDGPYEVVHALSPQSDVRDFTDTVAIPGPYYYYLAAVDKAGNEGHSRLVFVEVQDVVPPFVPKHVAIIADTGKITLSWQRNLEPDLKGYLIYRTSLSDRKQNYVLLNAEPIPESKFVDVLPKNVRTKFLYYIVATDTSFNRSTPSKVVTAAMPDILPPEKPFIKSVGNEGENILIEWIANVDTDLMGYDLYRSDTSRTFRKININRLGRNSFRYTDRDNDENVDYFYRLIAVDSAGNESIPSKEMYARRVNQTKTDLGSVSVKVKYNKRLKIARLQWVIDGENILGAVVYRGSDQSFLRPVTGLIKDSRYIDKLNSESKEVVIYQVRVYHLPNGISYSQIYTQKL